MSRRQRPDGATAPAVLIQDTARQLWKLVSKPLGEVTAFLDLDYSAAWLAVQYGTESEAATVVFGMQVTLAIRILPLVARQALETVWTNSRHGAHVHLTSTDKFWPAATATNYGPMVATNDLISWLEPA